MSDIEREVIALPDLQRPFVWEDTGARQLLTRSSWASQWARLFFGKRPTTRTPALSERKDRAFRATALVIDGQQRLTSLYAVMRGV